MSYRKYTKTVTYIGVLLLTLLETAACSLHPFSTVRIKANPTVYAPLGSKTVTEDTIFQKVTETLSTGDNKIHVYRYTPSSGTEGNDQLRYLLHYPIESFDFNIGSYFGGDISSGNTLSRSFDTAISVPAIDETKTLDIDTEDINIKLLEKFNTPPIPPLSVPVPAGISGEHELAVDITFVGFDTISFDSVSYLMISVHPNSMSYRITKAKMESIGTTVYGDINGYDVRFPLDDKTIGNVIRLTLTINNISGGPGNTTISRTLFGKITKATGVNTELNEIGLTPGQASFSLPEDFKSAEIGEGSLQLSMNQPAEWQGITITEKTEIQQAGAGGLSIIPTTFQPLGTAVDLAGKTLNDQPVMTYAPKLKVRLDNATYTVKDNLSAVFHFSINRFSKITLKNRPNFTNTQDSPVPADMKSWVKRIDLKKATVKIKLHNGLPQGNPIDIHLGSTAFRISDTKTFNPGETEQEYKSNPASFTIDVEGTDTFDLTSKIILPGYNTTEDTVTLTDIATGSTIGFSGALSFDLDWENITLKSKVNQQSSFPNTGPLNLSVLSKLKDAKIKIDELPLYFYAGSESGLLDGKTIQIGLAAEYTKPDGSVRDTKELYTSTTHELNALPANVLPADTKTEYTGAIPKAMLTVKAGEPGVVNTLADIINEYPNDLRIVHKLTMDEITITRAQYDNLSDKGKAKVTVDLLLEIPFGFKVEDKRRMSLSDFTNTGTTKHDLLGRSSPHHNSQLLKVIRSIQLETNLTNGLGISPSIILCLKDSAGNPVIPEKSFQLATGKQTFSFTKDEWDRIIATYPVYAEEYMEFESGRYAIKKGFSVTSSFFLIADTEIDYSVKVN